EVGELGNLQAVEHHLPAHAPGAAGGPLPVIFFELDVVPAQVNAHRLKRFEVELLDIHRRRLEDELKLGVLEEAIRVLAVAAVGGTTRRLRIADPVRFWSEHAEKSLG